MPEQVILTLNAGSSSLKFALFTASVHPRRLWSGAIDRIGLPGARFQLSDARRTEVLDEPGRLDSHEAALTRVPNALDLVAVGHRIVHGGPDCDCPKRITPALLARLHRLTSMAPLHMPPNLAGVQAVQAARPDVLQLACFDTAFHHDLPRMARLTALPRAYANDGIRSYVFHGLSYEYIVKTLRDDGVNTDAERIIIAHLGNGASMAALRGGKPVETSMGFSTISGLPMGTRPGDLDLGIVLYLMQEKGILSDVAGAADILLVPDLVSGNILAKATAAGIAQGLSAPVVLTSRADPASARMASLALAALMLDRSTGQITAPHEAETRLAATPQPEHACCAPPATAAVTEAAA